VWPILWTAFLLLWQTPALGPSPEVFKGYLVPNSALLATTLYVLFYLGLEIANFKKAPTGFGVLAVSGVVYTLTLGLYHAVPYTTTSQSKALQRSMPSPSGAASRCKLCHEWDCVSVAHAGRSRVGPPCSRLAGGHCGACESLARQAGRQS
jgi:hypothetical protein